MPDIYFYTFLYFFQKKTGEHFHVSEHGNAIVEEIRAVDRVTSVKVNRLHNAFNFCCLPDPTKTKRFFLNA